MATYIVPITDQLFGYEKSRHLINIYVNDVLIEGPNFEVESSVTNTIRLEMKDDIKGSFKTVPTIFRQQFSGTTWVKLEDNVFNVTTNTGRVIIGTFTHPVVATGFRYPLELGLTETFYDLTFTGENSTLHIRQSTLPGGEVQLRDGDVLEDLPRSQSSFMNNYEYWVVADTGCQFTHYGSFIMDGKQTQITVVSPTDNTQSQRLDFHVETDIYISMDAVLVEPELPTEVLGFNHIYLVTRDDLSTIGVDLYNKRRTYFMSSTVGSGDPFIAEDPHTYIINTLQLPFAIPEEYINNRQSIQMGYTTLVATGLDVNRDKIRVDLGTIEVPYTFNNSYDFIDTSTTIHLPYLNPIHLETSYVMGQTIGIEYFVDLYSGEATVNLTSSLLGDKVIHSSITMIGNEVPFISRKQQNIVGDANASKSVLLNNTLTPFIEVMRNIPYQLDSQFNNELITTVDNLLNTTGRIIVNKIALKTDATIIEENMIESILSSGVTIK